MIKKVALLASHVGASLRSSVRQYMKRGLNSEKIAQDFGFIKPDVPWYKQKFTRTIRRLVLESGKRGVKIVGPWFVAEFPEFNDSRQVKRAKLFSRAFAERSLRTMATKNGTPNEPRRDRRRKARLASHIAFLSMASASKVR